MRPERALHWKVRLAVVYAVGTWTLLGSMFFCSWPRREEQQPGKEGVAMEEEVMPADAHFVSTVTYRQLSAPRLYDKVISFFTSGDGPGPEE